MKYFEEKNDYLVTELIFRDFSSALNFVNKVGELAEKLNHHPDICLFNYKNVKISTTTHDSNNTVTEKDIKLVKEIEKVYDELFLF